MSRGSERHEQPTVQEKASELVEDNPDLIIDYSNGVTDLCSGGAKIFLDFIKTKDPSQVTRVWSRSLQKDYFNRDSDGYLFSEFRLELERISANPETITLDDLLSVPNIFDDKDAERVISLIQDTIQYGNSIYNLLTGKFYHGTKEEELKLEGSEKYKQDFSDYLEALPKGFVDEGDVSNISNEDKKYTLTNDWLHYIEKTEDSEPTEFRVYFNCDMEDTIETFEELIKELASDEELTRLGFQLKTFNARDLTAKSIINQKDRIVFYAGPQGLQRALPIIQRLGLARKESFQNKEGIFAAMPLPLPDGSLLEGVSICSKTIGEEPELLGSMLTRKTFRSYNRMQSLILQHCFEDIVNELKVNAQDLLTDLTKEDIDELKKGSTDFRKYFKILLSQKRGYGYLSSRLKERYVYWSDRFGMSKTNIAFKKPTST